MTEKNDTPDQPEYDTAEDFATLLAEQGAVQSLRLQIGDQVTGRVIHSTRESVFVQLSPTQEAVIARVELENEDGELTVREGDEVEAFVADLRNGIELRRKLSGERVDIIMLEQAHEKRVPVEGMVTGVNKGGLEVTLGGARAFCPISQIDLDFVQDAQEFVGKTLEFVIKEIREGGRNVLVSRRALLETRRAEQARELLRDLEVGQRRNVTVTRLATFGAFADLGGIDGLIPISQLSHGNVESVDQVLREGDQVEVEVMRVDEDPEHPEKPRIALSLKATLADPFVAHAADLNDGASLEGRVARIEKFGAFVELFPGVQGLVHISEMADRRIRHPSDVVTEGEMVTVRVLGVDPEKQRVSLSLKEAEPQVAPGDGHLRVGAAVQGTVDRVEPFGVFVALEGGGRALLPAVETGTPRGTDLGRAYPEGMSLDLTIIAIDERGRIKVSQKARAAADERAVVESFNRNQSSGSGLGTLGDLFANKLKR
jgi:small subunit ribosomal protein S1